MKLIISAMNKDKHYCNASTELLGVKLLSDMCSLTLILAKTMQLNSKMYRP